MDIRSTTNPKRIYVICRASECIVREGRKKILEKHCVLGLVLETECHAETYEHPI